MKKHATPWILTSIFLLCGTSLAAQTPSGPQAPRNSQSPQGPQGPPADTEARIDKLETGLESLSEEVRSLKAMIERLVAAVPELQGASEVAGKVEQLEQATDRLKTEQESLTASMRSTEEAVDSLSGIEERRSQVTVYGTLNFSDGQGENSTFDAEAFELVLSGRPHPKLGFFAEIEFERAATVGGERGGEILLEQAYASYELSPLFSFRAGVLLVPFGNYNLNHYSPNRDVISRPLVSHVIAPADWTDNGLGLTGEAFLGNLWSFEYQLFAVAGLEQDITAVGTRDARQPFGQDNNNDKALVGRFAWSRGELLEFGVSGYSGKYDDDGRLRLEGWAGDALLTLGRLKLAGEYNRLEAQQLLGPPAVLDGYYGRVVLDVTPKSWQGRGPFPDTSLALVAQHDDAELMGPFDGLFERNRERRTTFGLNYRPSHQWVLKVNWEENKATNRPLHRGNFKGWLASVGFQF